MIEAKDNPQLTDIFMALVVMSKEQGESKARGVSIIAHLERINGTNDRQEVDIQAALKDIAVGKAVSKRNAWIIGVMVSVIAIAVAVFESGLL